MDWTSVLASSVEALDWMSELVSSVEALDCTLALGSSGVLLDCTSALASSVLSSGWESELVSGPVFQSWLVSEHESDSASGGASDRESEMTLGHEMASTLQLVSSQEVLDSTSELVSS